MRGMIGDKAERLAHIFCVVDRLTVDNDLDSAPDAPRVRGAPELGGYPIPVDDDVWFDFLALTLGDWLEQVEGAAQAPNALFEWGVGDAWGYRRGAYARMAERSSARRSGRRRRCTTKTQSRARRGDAERAPAGDAAHVGRDPRGQERRAVRRAEVSVRHETRGIDTHDANRW